MNKKYLYKSREEMLATEKMFPLIMKMSLPAVLAQLINLLYSIVDRIYIGHIAEVGKDALAGIGLTTSIIIFVSAFSVIVGGGGSPLASMALGENNRGKAEKILENGLKMLLIFAVFTTITGYLVKEPLLRLIGASDVTFPFANQYLNIYLAGTIFVQLSVGMNGFISSQGRSGISMVCVLIGAVLNIILDPIFIFVLDMKIAGAALATIISQAASATAIIVFLVSKKATLRLKIFSWKLDFSVVLSIVKIGIAPFVMAITESFIGFVLNGNLQKYGGDIYVSALAVLQSAMQVMTVPLTGFTNGVTPIISYNYGAGNTDRVKRCFYDTLIIMFSLMFLGSLVMALFPRYVGMVFTLDVALLDVVEKYMPMFFGGIFIFGLQRACQTTFVALGQAGISLFIAMLRKIILLIPLAIILPRIMNLGVTGVYLAEPIADSISAITCTTIFFLTFKKILSKKEKASM